MIVKELSKGVFVYKDVFKKELDIINRLESILSDKKIPYSWKNAQVGDGLDIKDYRDCLDFKIKKEHSIFPKDKYWKKLEEVWQDCFDAQQDPIKHYCSIFNLELNYWEGFNFIKYGPGQHFKEHSDHGYSYVSTLSSVGYLNDDYKDGELLFNKIGLKIKPEAGDLYLFPSSYLFAHQALPVTSGTKYSIVTMLDYNDRAHKDVK
jgi:hypothetical protein